MKFTLFTTNTCSFCPMVKQILDKFDRDYSVIDVTDDYEKRLELQKKYFATSVPVLVREDGEFMVGFSQPKMFALVK